MGEVDERKCCNGNEICQTMKGSNAGLFDRKSTFDVLEKDVDLPAVVGGVGDEDGGFAHRFLSPVFLDEVGGVVAGAVAIAWLMAWRVPKRLRCRCRKQHPARV